MSERDFDRLLEHYVDHLEVHPDEFAALFNTILINVTSFFRDPSGVGVRRPAARAGDARREGPPALK